MGDLIATCISPHSRNRYVGEQLGAGRSLEEILAEMSMVAEGVKTAVTVHELAARHSVEMPVCDQIYRVVTGEINAGRRLHRVCGCQPATRPNPASPYVQDEVSRTVSRNVAQTSGPISVWSPSSKRKTRMP